MSAADPALAKIREAASGINRAAGLWDATNIERVEGCRQALESAATTMKEAQEILISKAGSSRGVAAQTTALKAETLRLERLVDAAAAMLRTACPEMSGCAPVYGRAGTVASESASSNRGIQA